MKKNKRRNKLMLLILLVLAISIGFALLSTTLKINGSAVVNKGAWDIYWDNVEVSSGSKEATLPVIGNDPSDKPKTKVTWTVNFDIPGDFYEFTVDAVNAGSMDAVITDISSTITDGVDPVNLPSYISYRVTYADGTGITVNDPLNKADTSTTPATPTRRKYKVRLEFLDTITPEEMNDLPEEGLNYEFEYDVTYGQASVNDMSRKTLASLKACNQNIAGKTDEELVPLYSCRVEGFNTIYPVNWDLFYSDSDYIYLIVDDYVESKYLPAELYKYADRDYACGFADSGSRGLIFDDPRWSSGVQSDAIQNNPLTSKYLRWVNEYPNSTNDNIRATAYMMDTSIWANFAGNIEGAFAMGGPTLELFISSYNAVHPLQIETYDNMVRDTNVFNDGYKLKWVDFYGNHFNWTNSLSSPNLFARNDLPNMWDSTYGPVTDVYVYYLAAPTANSSGRSLYGINSGAMYSYNVDSPYYSFRPLVAIPKSSIK